MEKMDSHKQDILTHAVSAVTETAHNKQVGLNNESAIKYKREPGIVETAGAKSRLLYLDARLLSLASQTLSLCVIYFVHAYVLTSELLF